MIKWRSMSTSDRYTFNAYRTKKGYGNIILLTDAKGLYSPKMSLTNNMEKVLDHFLIGLNFGKENVNKIQFYQWVENDGLFKLEFGFEPCPHKGIVTYDLKWQFITKDLKHFEVLYCD